MRLAITSRKQTPTELRIEDVFDTVWRVIGGRRCLLLPPEEAQLRLDLGFELPDNALEQGSICRRLRPDERE